MEKSKFQEDTSMENTVEMKDRIAHIIRAKNLTAAEFAMKLDTQTLLENRADVGKEISDEEGAGMLRQGLRGKKPHSSTGLPLSTRLSKWKVRAMRKP